MTRAPRHRQPLPHQFVEKQSEAPHQIVCSKCGTKGLVRVEHIIRGSYASRAYDCGGCGYAWTVADTSPASAKPPQA